MHREGWARGFLLLPKSCWKEGGGEGRKDIDGANSSDPIWVSSKTSCDLEEPVAFTQLRKGC